MKSRYGKSFKNSPSSGKTHSSRLSKQKFFNNNNNLVMERSLAELIRQKCTDYKSDINYQIERNTDPRDIKQVVDWSKENSLHITAKKILLNSTNNNHIHNNFLKNQMNNSQYKLNHKNTANFDKNHFKINHMTYRDTGDNKLKVSRSEVFNTARNEYMQNRVKFGLFAGRELNDDGIISFERYDRVKEDDRRKPSIFFSTQPSRHSNENNE